MPTVNPEILIWARETAGFSLSEAAHVLGLQDTKTKTGMEKLAALEAGERDPSRSQLIKMAEKYRRSLLVFYLNEPPQQGDRGQDFRSLPNTDEVSFNANLDALIRDVKARQGLVKSLVEDEDAQPLPFIDSVEMNYAPIDVAEKITTSINFSLAHFRARKNVSEAFAYIRQRIESSGIFVLLVGDLGSHHTAIPLETFRGFAIADPIAPFVVVNDHDARVAWSFTVLHEVVHLWLGTTGVSSSSDVTAIEQFCNEVAGNILLPPQELNELQKIQQVSFEAAISQLTAFADTRKISRAMVAYKLFKSGQLEETRWRAFSARFNQERIEMNARIKAQQAGEGSGPSYYVVRRHRLGPALLNLVSRSIDEGTLSPTKAGKILGVKPRNVEPLLNYASLQGGS